MKRIVFFMVTLFLMGGVMMAQGPRDGKKMDPKARAEKMTERMAKELSLNDTQKQQLLELNLAQTEKMCNKASMSKDQKCDKKGKGKASEMTKEDRKKMREEMRASRDAYDAQLKKILTNEQYESYTKKQAEHMQKMRNGHKSRDGQKRK
ncbi:DUF4890 domain-containing protein [Oscillospiraceae bacterium N12]|jgi:protein CpxP|uniref:DUF4890 domain-containing protein n=1 Tax=Jilunia laotingensis TaxID=2763675 RepID=A0A926IS51_9BACT|nr:DUF4890 domain-containing protein [Jilunia laotingensis]MBC8595170.1 DUF4890 domain-containing protein [Jilunia laotingensis]